MRCDAYCGGRSRRVVCGSAPAPARPENPPGRPAATPVEGNPLCDGPLVEGQLGRVHRGFAQEVIPGGGVLVVHLELEGRHPWRWGGDGKPASFGSWCTTATVPTTNTPLRVCGIHRENPAGYHVWRRANLGSKLLSTLCTRYRSSLQQGCMVRPDGGSSLPPDLGGHSPPTMALCKKKTLWRRKEILT